MSLHNRELTHLLAPITDDIQQVNHVIRQRLSSEVALINQISEYIINAGGKRLRPALLLLIARALAVRSDHQYVLAAIIELIHTATLLHDDVVDHANLRRGKETANALFGSTASVLVGDFLYSRAFQMMVAIQRPRVMQILSDATNVIAQGEVLQLLNRHDPNPNETHYRQVVYYKTAKLFEASAQLGAVLADADQAIEAAAVEFGRRIGMAFQMMDDWLDYAGDTQSIGKDAGNDLCEGKPTLPLIYLLERGTDEQRTLAQKAIEEGGADCFEKIFSAAVSSGALHYTLQCAKREAGAAVDALLPFPDSVYKESLLQLCDYSTARRC